MKGYRRYIALIGLLFGLLVLLEYLRPKPVDWTETLSRQDKIPYGTYALYNLLPDLFPGLPVQAVQEPIYNLLQDSLAQGNYVFINPAFEVDTLNLNRLLDFVAHGNQVFIATEFMSNALQDTLSVFTYEYHASSPDSTQLHLTGQTQAYTFPGRFYSTALAVDSLQGHRVLGRNGAGHINFLHVPFGEGTFYLHSVPQAFTNYQLLTLQQPDYAAKALSYLPLQPVYWDDYMIRGRFEDTSVFQVLVRYEALRWSFYVALGAMVLFLLFQSKRRQRIIPVLEPPRNTTLDFVKAISGLYFNHGTHKNIAEKQITYFLEQLRLHYHLPTQDLSEELQQRVITKSGAEEVLVQEIFLLIDSILRSDSIGDQTLLRLNNLLENFYDQTAIAHRAKA